MFVAELRREEEHVRRVIERAYGLPVMQFDDGTEEAMYDLQIEHRDGTRAAVEITSDADGASIALWRLLNDREDRWIEPGIAGGWSVSLRPDARAKRIRVELPQLLRVLEALGIARVEFDDCSEKDPLRERLFDVGMSSAYQGGTDYPGSIYPTIELPAERSGGAVSDNGDATARWLSDFVRDPERADVLRKLKRSGLEERHAFVVLAPFGSAPFVALHPLMDQDATPPSVAPELPVEVTQVWVMSSWRSGVGFHWHPKRGWSRFDTSI